MPEHTKASFLVWVNLSHWASTGQASPECVGLWVNLWLLSKGCLIAVNYVNFFQYSRKLDSQMHFKVIDMQNVFLRKRKIVNEGLFQGQSSKANLTHVMAEIHSRFTGKC